MSGELNARIRRLIDESGPLPVSDYMAMCLFDPEFGYYTTREPFGVDGDFTTAPEISQMFGEIIGAWLVHAWRALECPAPIALVEIGPGRGTLAADIMRAARIDPLFVDAARLHLVEASPRLRDVQRLTLERACIAANWHESIRTLPDMPALFVANELFDALPVHQIEFGANGWFERRVGRGGNGALTFVEGAPLPTPGFLAAIASNPQRGDIFEYAPAREAFISDIAARLARNGGVALFVDYGHDRPGFGDTLQALHRHRAVDVFELPGESDLTSHVDFAALKRASEAAGAHAFPVMRQGDFLLSSGLAERAGALGTGKPKDVQDDIRSAVERLAGDGATGMGDLFKVLCIAAGPVDLAPFAGSHVSAG